MFKLFSGDKEIVRQPLHGFPNGDAAALRAAQTRKNETTLVKNGNGNTVKAVLPQPKMK